MLLRERREGSNNSMDVVNRQETGEQRLTVPSGVVVSCLQGSLHRTITRHPPHQQKRKLRRSFWHMPFDRKSRKPVVRTRIRISRGSCLSITPDGTVQPCGNPCYACIGGFTRDCRYGNPCNTTCAGLPSPLICNGIPSL